MVQSNNDFNKIGGTSFEVGICFEDGTNYEVDTHFEEGANINDGTSFEVGISYKDGLHKNGRSLLPVFRVENRMFYKICTYLIDG